MYPLSIKHSNFTYNLNDEHVTVDTIKANIDDMIMVVFKPYIVMAANEKINLIRTFKYNEERNEECWIDSEGKIVDRNDIDKKLRNRLIIELMLD